ncbi:MAG: MFS transporter [Eggerthellales bacterium]|nr:MFS transporter [Eggerthellales bacterium]
MAARCSTPSSHTPALTVSQRHAFLIIAACSMVAGIPCAIVLNCAGMFFTPVSSSLGVSRSSFALYYSCLSLCCIIAVAICGSVMTRVNMRTNVTACAALCGITLIAMSQFTQVWMFHLAGALLGFGAAPLVLAIPILVGNWFHCRVGLFTGVCMSFTGIGGMVFNLISSAFITIGPEGWRLGYLVYGLVILLFVCPITFAIVRSKPSDLGLVAYGEEGAPQTVQTDNGQTSIGSTRHRARFALPSTIWRSSVFFCLAAFGFLSNMNQVVYQFMASYCQCSGDSQVIAAVGAVAGACMIGQAIGKILLGHISDTSLTTSLALGLCGAAAGAIIMWVAPTCIPLLIIGAFSFGFVYACTMVVVPMLTRLSFGSANYTRVYSWVSTFCLIGQTLGSVLFAFLTDLPQGFDAMFAVSLLLTAIAARVGFKAVHNAIGHTLLQEDQWQKPSPPGKKSPK